VWSEFNLEIVYERSFEIAGGILVGVELGRSRLMC